MVKYTFLYFVTMLTVAACAVKRWSRDKPWLLQAGSVAIGNILDGLIVMLLGIILVFNFVPIIEDEAVTDNITNPTTKTFADLAGWVLPVIGIIGLIYVGIRTFVSKSRGKGKG